MARRGYLLLELSLLIATSAVILSALAAGVVELRRLYVASNDSQARFMDMAKLREVLAVVSKDVDLHRIAIFPRVSAAANLQTANGDNIASSLDGEVFSALYYHQIEAVGVRPLRLLLFEQQGDSGRAVFRDCSGASATADDDSWLLLSDRAVFSAHGYLQREATAGCRRLVAEIVPPLIAANGETRLLAQTTFAALTKESYAFVITKGAELRRVSFSRGLVTSNQPVRKLKQRFSFATAVTSSGLLELSASAELEPRAVGQLTTINQLSRLKIQELELNL